MGSLSVLMMILTIIFMVRIFISKHSRRILLYAIKWSTVSIVLAFTVGFVMIGLLSRYFGENGNFIWSHGFAFHALQIIPLVGWFLEKVNERKAKMIISITAMLWNIVVVLLAVQAYSNETLFQGLFFYINLLIGFIISLIVGYTWYLWNKQRKTVLAEIAIDN